MPARSGARWWPRIIVLAACVLTAVACSSAAPARDAARPARDALPGARVPDGLVRRRPGPDRIEVNYKIPPQEDPLYGKDNALVTGNWPTPPDPDPESSLIGQSYVCSVTSNFPMVVTDPGSWVWACAGVRADESLQGAGRPGNLTSSTRRGRRPGRSVLARSHELIPGTGGRPPCSGLADLRTDLSAVPGAPGTADKAPALKLRTGPKTTGAEA